jgi:2-keto-4-pentenoate hydratase/2-oxohepta-3-ene-1,7-dioic acid hydratase in catechol pathway
VRFATYRLPAAPDTDRVGVVVGEALHALPPGTTLRGLLGDDGERLAAAGEQAQRDPHDVTPLAEVRLRAPIPDPTTVRDFYAFEQHVRTARQRRGLDMDPDWYELPVFYFSNPYAVTDPDAVVSAPPGCAELDFELEVAAVLGRGGSDLDPETAETYVAGYTVMNDWSARDVQRREMKLSMGPVKGKDFATSLGPFLVTPDELAPHRTPTGYDLTMTATVNGREYSRATWGEVHYSMGEMVAYASRGTRVEPGDVIGTGTCGTGCILELSMVHGSEAYPWLVEGDEVVLAVDGLGALRNVIGPAASDRGYRKQR